MPWTVVGIAPEGEEAGEGSAPSPHKAIPGSHGNTQRNAVPGK